ncbi:hypothetical protein B1812_21030 [Methylocystis bryophila]|uniref:Uncharacterized protein n=1 Tax=Methylocystis bryophila TaxID=655015 RepID=A0A1W6MZY5_9HYPH|nr:hypothetical protein B1812_21030 [Methylocystis bryophila]
MIMRQSVTPRDELERNREAGVARFIEKRRGEGRGARRQISQHEDELKTILPSDRYISLFIYCLKTFRRPFARSGAHAEIEVIFSGG